jgi:epoxyqueuosine reductase
MDLTERIKEKARDIGFSKVGITDASPLSENIVHHFHEWIEKRYYGDLEYLKRSRDKRVAPEEVLKGARSVISAAINYNPGNVVLPEDDRSARISRYALGMDYHDVVSKKLRKLLDFIEKEVGNTVRGDIFCDTGPLMEKVIAERAGVGWIGKNGVLVTQEFGSWVFLGEILVDIPLSYDTPARNLCSSCTLCMESCPTSAIVSPGTVDVSRCISYQTVENRNTIPEELRSAIGNRIFGCDCCQEVCPYNSGVDTTTEQQFFPKSELVSAPLEMLFAVTEKRFKDAFGDSAIERAKSDGFLRNIIVAMGNSGQPGFIPLLENAMESGNILLREHAEWAIERIVETERNQRREMG